MAPWPPASCSPPPPRPPGLPPRAYASTPLDCGKIAEADADPYADDGAYKGVPKTLVVPCFLIRHPKGDLLWETGLPQAVADLPGGQGAYGMSVARKLTDQLKALGLTPADIEYLSVSHSHYDHIGNGGLFAARSTWIVDADERAYAFRPAARADKDEFPPTPPGDRPHHPDRGRRPLRRLRRRLGDDHPGPGAHAGPHRAPGPLPKAGPVLLTGDLWHIAESQAARRVPRFNTSRAQTLASMDKVEALARDAHARLVREHVAQDIAALPPFPQPLR